MYSPKLCENCCLYLIVIFSIGVASFEKYFGLLYLTFIKIKKKAENVNFSHLVPFCQSLSQLYIYKALKMAIDIVKFSGQSVFYSGPKKNKLHE